MPKLKPLTNRFALYEASVQSVLYDVEFIDRLYARRRGRKAVSLREDFCGTFALSAAWVRSGRQRTALGLDLAPAPLAYGRKNHWLTLPEADRPRLKAERRNVLAGSKPCDIVVAQNFSYFCFRTRDSLRDYFRSVAESIAPHGLFCLDIFGGPETETPRSDKHRIRPKGFAPFDYYWELLAFNPIDRRADYRIHFKQANGRWQKSAFRYDWRMWTVPEVREILAEAGFRSVEFLWEEDSGAYRPRKVAENDPAWLGYIIASRPEQKPRARKQQE